MKTRIAALAVLFAVAGCGGSTDEMNEPAGGSDPGYYERDGDAGSGEGRDVDVVAGARRSAREVCGAMSPQKVAGVADPTEAAERVASDYVAAAGAAAVQGCLDGFRDQGLIP